jgi:hypothetical protein
MGRVMTGGRWGNVPGGGERGCKHRWTAWKVIGQFSPYRERKCEKCGAKRVQRVRK